MAVIAAISAMQVAGGLDYLVNQTEKLLRKNPKYITILAPIVTYFLTIFAGTGNISGNAAGYCRSREGAGNQTLPSALDRRGIRADCDYRLADFCGRGVYVFCYGRSWH